jgi:multimeric flavodoxin WrbA
MKILGFVGSPRKKGNTDILVDTFLEGAQSQGVEVKKLLLAKMDIHQCEGCFRNCMVKPAIHCPRFDDDMHGVIEDMLDADLMLFASPLYCGSYTAIMARFFERLLPVLEVEVVGKEGTKEGYKMVSNPLKGKNAIIGLVQDLVYPQVGELPLKVFEHNVGGTYGMNIIEKLHVVDVRDKGDIKKKEDQLKEIFEKGAELAAG